MVTNFIIIFIFLFSVDAKPKAPAFTSEENGCLAYVKLDSKSNIETYGKNCEVQMSPCSTFKITLAELGFKNKKLDVTEIFQWDGVIRERKALNKNQDVYSWMKDSVVWVSSIVVERIGRNKVHSELKNLDYGNALIGPNEFWIHGPLKISVEELTKILSRAQNKNLTQALSLLPQEHIEHHTVMGKTGSCYIDDAKKKQQVGWYVGRFKSNDNEYAFALRYADHKNHETKGPAGFRAKELFLDWLKHF